MKRRKVSTVIIIVGIVLVLAALVIYCHNVWVDRQVGKSMAQVRQSLEIAMGTYNDEIVPDRVETLEEETVEQDPHADGSMATIEIEGYAYIGTLSIPRFGLELPIMEEWSYAGMRLAPGRYTGSPWTDDLVICGHNYDSHFGKLKQLEAGDIVTFTDVEGNVFLYEAVEVETLQPTDVKEMLSGDWDLTLFTCTLGGDARVTVRCMRVDD